MGACTGLTVVKRFTYRGDATEEFSNTYHFKGSPPGDDASWQVLLNDVESKEQPLLNMETFFSRAYGYDSDDPTAHHVFSLDHGGTGAAGTYFPATGSEYVMAGDQAGCAQWRLNRLSAKGKPLYLRKYIHGGYINKDLPDNLGQWWSAMIAFCDLATGINSVHGGLRSLSHDDSVVAAIPIAYVTTRTLKRRGKRPRTGS